MKAIPVDSRKVKLYSTTSLAASSSLLLFNNIPCARSAHTASGRQNRCTERLSRGFRARRSRRRVGCPGSMGSYVLRRRTRKTPGFRIIINLFLTRRNGKLKGSFIIKQTIRTCSPKRGRSRA